MKFVSAKKKLSEVVSDPKLWRFLGFGSSVVGFVCYGLSSSFHALFGQWNVGKMLFLSIIGLMISVFMLFVKKIPHFPSSRGFLLQADVSFSVLMLTSLYSYLDENGHKGHNPNYQEILSLVSCGSFWLMSLSLSRQIQPGFELGVSNFFLGYLIVEVMKRNFWVALGFSSFGYVVIVIRCYSDSLLERQRLGDDECENLNHTCTHHVAIDLASLLLHEDMQSSEAHSAQDTEKCSVMEVIGSQGEEEAEIDDDDDCLISGSHNELVPSLDNDIGRQESDTSDDDDETNKQIASLIQWAYIWFRVNGGATNHSFPLLICDG